MNFWRGKEAKPEMQEERCHFQSSYPNCLFSWKFWYGNIWLQNGIKCGHPNWPRYPPPLVRNNLFFHAPLECGRTLWKPKYQLSPPRQLSRCQLCATFRHPSCHMITIHHLESIKQGESGWAGFLSDIDNHSCTGCLSQLRTIVLKSSSLPELWPKSHNLALNWLKILVKQLQLCCRVLNAIYHKNIKIFSP